MVKREIQNRTAEVKCNRQTYRYGYCSCSFLNNRKTCLL